MFTFRYTLGYIPVVYERACMFLCMQEQAVNARGAGNTTVSSGQATPNMHRRLGMCEGVEYTSMLEEMMKGANVLVSGDSGNVPPSYGVRLRRLTLVFSYLTHSLATSITYRSPLLERNIILV